MTTRREFLKYAASMGLTMPCIGRSETSVTTMPYVSAHALPQISPYLPDGGVSTQRMPSTAAPPRAPSGLAWRAERGTQRFLLVGTLHALSPQDHPLPRVIDDCYAKSAGILLEFTPYEQSLPEAKKTVQAKGSLPTPNGLLEMLPEQTRASLRKFLATRPGMRYLLACKPWLAAQWIQQALGTECGLEGVHGVESYLCRRAGADRKPIQLLETQSDALDALDALPAEVQLETLSLTLKLAEQGKYRALTESLRAAWRAGNETQLNALFASTTEDAIIYRKTIIEGRNLTWIKLIQTIKSSGTWMIAAGTQHFCGEHSIGALLRAEGFKVERIA
jgi:uncharacterized protein YbaP (TraB family)